MADKLAEEKEEKEMLCGDIPDQQKSKNVAASETETASENVERSRQKENNEGYVAANYFIFIRSEEIFINQAQRLDLT